MKKLAAVVVVALVVGTSWLWWNELPPIGGPREAAPVPEAQPAVADLPSALPGAAVQAGERVAMPTGPAEAGAPRAPTPTDLWGRVVEAGTDKPIAGAAVELLHCDADEFWNLDLVYGKRMDTIARATSDGDGRFRFEVERARQHRLHVTAAGYAPVTVTDQVGGTDVVIAVSPGASLDGVVRCGQELVADVDVRIAVRGKSVELARGRTDGGGGFRFTGLPPAQVFVQVGSDRFQEEWQDLDVVASMHHHVEIELSAGKTLRGRVLDAATGTPVFDAEVSDSWTMKREVRTDSDGRFALAGLREEGHVTCHVKARGYASARLDVGGKLGEDIEVRLVRGGEVAGRIVDGMGAPVATAYAAVAASFREATGQGSNWIPAAVGGDGSFQALGLRPDQHYWLFVRAAGFGTRVYALARKLGSGERLEVGDVVLQPAGGIEGRVVDDTGAGVPGLEVNVSGTNADSLAWFGTAKGPTHVTQFEGRSVVSDRNGCFRITGLAGGTFEVNVYAPGHSEPVSTKVEVQDGKRVENVELVLTRGLAISGVVDLGGGPARAEPLFLEASKDQGDKEYNVMVGADGAFRFDGLPEGSYVLTMRDPPKGWSMAACVGVRAGTTGLKLLLEPAAVITGRVVDEAGKPVEARVWTSADGVEAGSTMRPTDAEGRFRLEVPPAFRGKVGAAIEGQWHRRGEQQGVTAGQTDVVVSLRETGPSRGR